MTGPEELAGLVRHALATAGLPDAEPVFERPRNREHGDWSTNVALTLAKAAKQAPRAIAEQVIANLVVPDDISGIEVAGPGFVNFRLSHTALEEIIRAAVAQGSAWGRQPTAAGVRGRVLVEFVSANPTGPLHVGAGRWAAAGDAIAALLDASGWEVQREYYLNDTGGQLDLFGASVAAVMRGEPPPEDGYLGAYINDLAAELTADGLVADGPTVDAVTEAAYQRMLAQIQATMVSFGVTYDQWFSERTLHASGAVQAAIAQLDALGHVYVAAEATWLRTTTFGDDKDRVLVRADGRPTYFAADCAYLRDKFARGFDRCIYLLGADHHGYVGRLQAIVAAFGLKSDQVEIIVGQLVTLLRDGTPVRMGKRSGQFVTFDELIQEVGADAARYTFLRTSLDVSLDFDIAQVVREERDNPVYYVQYSHARIAGIMRKARQLGVVPGDVGDAPLDLLGHPTEDELIRRIGAYPETVAYAAEERAPHRVARYAEDLAEGFHRFYTECQVVGDDAAVTRARYWLCVATRQTLINALGLLGVRAPDRM